MIENEVVSPECILMTRVVAENGEVKRLTVMPVRAIPESVVGSVGICLTFFTNHEPNGACEALGKLDLLATFDNAYNLTSYLPIVKLHLVLDNPEEELAVINNYLLKYKTGAANPFLITYAGREGAPGRSFTFDGKVLVEPALVRADSFKIGKRASKGVRIKMGPLLFVSIGQEVAAEIPSKDIITTWCDNGNQWGTVKVGRGCTTTRLLTLNSPQCQGAPVALKNVFFVRFSHGWKEHPTYRLQLQLMPFTGSLQNQFKPGTRGVCLEFMPYQGIHPKNHRMAALNALSELDDGSVARPSCGHWRVIAFTSSPEEHAELLNYLDDYKRLYRINDDNIFELQYLLPGDEASTTIPVDTKKPETLLFNKHWEFEFQVDSATGNSKLVFDQPKVEPSTVVKDLGIPIERWCVGADHYGLFNKDGVVSEQLIEKDCKECIENLMKPASGDRTPPTLLNLTPSISGKVLTQDVITGFEAYEDLGIGVNRRPCLKLTLKIEKRVGTPSLRQSNLFITTAKAKGYGPVFIVDEEIALSLSEALQEFYKRSTTNKPVLGFTDVCTDDLSKPVNTPLGKLFEAQLTFKGDDAQRQAKFFDFGVKDLEA